MNDSQTVKIGAVSILVYPWRDSWRFAWRGLDGSRKFTTRRSLDDALAAAKDKAREIGTGIAQLRHLSKDEQMLVVEFLKLKPSWEDVAELKARKYREPVPVAETVKRFLTAKESTQGASERNVCNLRYCLGVFVGAFGDRDLAGISVLELDQFFASLRTRAGAPMAACSRHVHRKRLSTFYRWARRVGLLPAGETAICRTSPIRVERAQPATWTPAEWQTLLESVQPRFAPWLLLAGFAGLRTAELYRQSREKPVLRWEDIHWDRGIIIVPEAVSKTRRGVVPIQPGIKIWLEHHGVRPPKAGDICTGCQPRVDKSPSEPTRLGGVLGCGWRHNALRHSYISYRAAVVGLGKAAMEARNSESESAKSYLDAKSESEARAYFGARPK